MIANPVVYGGGGSGENEVIEAYSISVEGGVLTFPIQYDTIKEKRKFIIFFAKKEDGIYFAGVGITGFYWDWESENSYSPVWGFNGSEIFYSGNAIPSGMPSIYKDGVNTAIDLHGLETIIGAEFLDSYKIIFF